MLLRHQREALVRSFILYHGTSTGTRNRRLRSILANGLRDPKRKKLKYEEGASGTYLTANLAEAMWYADRATNEDTYETFCLFVIVRTDVAGVQSFLDTDLSGKAGAFMPSFWKLSDKIIGESRKFKAVLHDTQKFRLLLDNTIAMAVDQHLAKWFKRLGITAWLPRDYARAKDFLVQLAKFKFLLAFSDYEMDVVPFLTEVEPSFEGLSINKIFNLLGEDPTTLEITENLKVLLLSPKLTSTGDKTYSLRVEDTIGYAGTTRIIGVVSWDKNIDLSPFRLRTQGKTMNVPIGQIHVGQNVGVVQALVTKLAGHRNVNIDSKGICWVIYSVNSWKA